LIDGVNGAVGLVIGLLGSGAGPAIVLAALLARAGSSAVSMAGAEYEANDDKVSRRVRVNRVAAMGGGYLTSALLPGLGFAVSSSVGLSVFIPATIAILLLISWFRHRKVGWVSALMTTLIVFFLAVGAGLLASLVGSS
jgi:hypothetical protein